MDKNFVNKITDIEAVTLMFNPSVRDLVKANSAELLEQFYDNSLCQSMIELIRDEPEITRTSLGIYLIGLGISGNLQSQILQIYDNSQILNEAEVKQLSEVIINYVASVKIRDIREKYPEDPIKYIESIQKVDISKISQDLKSSSSTFKEMRFGDITSEVIDEYLGDSLSCCFKTYNRTTAVKGFFASQLICITAPPAGGKTMWMMNQAVHALKKGIPVCWLALGDMNPADFNSRISAIVCGVPINEVVMHASKYHDMAIELCPALKDKFLLDFENPEKLSLETYINYLTKNNYDKEFKVNFFDYDSNFMSKYNDDMYYKGGETYNLAKAYADNIVGWVFIGSQPKINYYSEEVLPLEVLSESSKKQHIVDVVLTFSKTGNQFNHTGMCGIVKNRRGITSSVPFFIDPSGQFFELNEVEYNTIKGDLTSLTLIQGNSKYGPYRETNLSNLSNIKKDAEKVGVTDLPPEEIKRLLGKING